MLLLFPAAVMVVLVLAAIVVDIGFTRVRVLELRAVAASAANDALGAVDVDSLRSTGLISFDSAAAQTLVRSSVAAGPVPAAAVESVIIARDSAGRWEIAVTLSVTIDRIIAPALPGADSSLTATVTERAVAV